MECREEVKASALLLEPSKNLACVLRHSFEKHQFAHDFALERNGFERSVPRDSVR
jgi:hypothetical protein